MKSLSPVPAVILLITISACNVTKHLPPGETLYAGSKVTVNSVEKKQVKTMREELNNLVRPKANTSFLGMRYKLWFYYAGGGDSSKGFRRFIRNKFGESPVYASQVTLEKNRQVLENHLQNKGYFQASVTADTETRKKLTTLKFDAYAGPQYRIRNVVWPRDSSTRINRAISKAKDKTLLEPGQPYDLDAIKNERVRIDEYLKNNGFYYFTPDYLIDRVDTTAGRHEADKHLVDMYLQVKPGAPDADLSPYRINDIWVYPTYTIEGDSMLAQAASEHYNDYNIIDPEHKFKPSTFSHILVFHKGDLYSRRAHNRSLNRLMSLNTFKFVKARFEEVDTTGNYLDPYFFLTPLPRRSLKLEVTGLTKSNNATGSELTLSWTDRNVFRGAEQLSISGFGGLETQVYGGTTTSITRFGGEMNLYVPRVLAPFRLNTNADFISKTRISLRYEYYDRTKQYTLNSYIGSYGFVWKTDVRTEHTLNVINLNYVQPQRIDPDFQAALDTDIILQRAIEPQFIFGPSYNFNYNTNNRPNFDVVNYYFNFNFEAPGNVLAVASGTEFNREKRGTGKFLNTVFAQYVRAEVDGRYYYRYGDKKHTTDIIASRLLVGVGYPYGNSFEMPFVKAFFIGGVNDLRAFRARSLGPGSYYVRNYKTSGIIPDQPGDIKLLGSLELRKKLVAIVNGAVFVDAGNIWTFKEDSTRPGSKFSSGWPDQIAVGVGAGLRFDLSFLVIRVDLATPVREPFNSGNAPGFDFGSRAYRRENLILNLALGYPF
jgi:outer membrane protein assembly factor BamA